MSHPADVYLSKWAKKYIVKRAEDGAQEIQCLGGEICVFDLEEKLLLYYFSDKDSKRKLAFFLKKLQMAGLWHKTHQHGDYEATIIFRDTDLEAYEKLFKIRKRKRFTLEQRQVLRSRMQGINLKKGRQKAPPTSLNQGGCLASKPTL